MSYRAFTLVEISGFGKLYWWKFFLEFSAGVINNFSSAKKAHRSPTYCKKCPRFSKGTIIHDDPASGRIHFTEQHSG